MENTKGQKDSLDGTHKYGWNNAEFPETFQYGDQQLEDQEESHRRDERREEKAKEERMLRKS